MHGERRTLRFRRVTRLGSYLLHLGAVRFCNVIHDVSSFASVPNQRPTVDGCTPRCRAICLFDQPSSSLSCAAFARRALTDTTVTGGVATSARPTSARSGNVSLASVSDVMGRVRMTVRCVIANSTSGGIAATDAASRLGTR